MNCYGRDLRRIPPPDRVDLQWLLEAFAHRKADSPFFKTEGFTRHAGTAVLQQQIESGMTDQQIRESWAGKLQAFKTIRARYLTYD